MLNMTIPAESESTYKPNQADVLEMNYTERPKYVRSFNRAVCTLIWLLFDYSFIINQIYLVCFCYVILSFIAGGWDLVNYNSSLTLGYNDQVSAKAIIPIKLCRVGIHACMKLLWIISDLTPRQAQFLVVWTISFVLSQCLADLCINILEMGTAAIIRYTLHLCALKYGKYKC